jgi:hypothetical protein
MATQHFGNNRGIVREQAHNRETMETVFSMGSMLRLHTKNLWVRGRVHELVKEL